MMIENSTCFNYQSILETSDRINWCIEDIIGGNKSLDFTKPFLPEALAGVNSISCLTNSERLKLNQIRGNSYLHLFALCEEFILPTIVDYLRLIGYDDIYATQAFLHFAEEESKHIQLFRRFAEEFDRGFGSLCDRIEPVRDICDAILKHHPLAVALLILHIEWMTQRHYLESVRDNQALDPQFCSLLRYHWLEEAQHAKLDALMIERIARELEPQDIEVAIADYFKITTLLDRELKRQVQFDIESLSRATRRRFSDAGMQEIQSTQEKSYQWTFLGSGMTHQNVVRMFSQLSSSGQVRLLKMSAVFG